MGMFIIEKCGCNIHLVYSIAKTLLKNNNTSSCERDVIDTTMEHLMFCAETPHDYMLIENIHKEYVTALTLLRTIRGVIHSTCGNKYRISLRLHLGWKEYQIVMEQC